MNTTLDVSPELEGQLQQAAQTTVEQRLHVVKLR